MHVFRDSFLAQLAVDAYSGTTERLPAFDVRPMTDPDTDTLWFLAVGRHNPTAILAVAGSNSPRDWWRHVFCRPTSRPGAGGRVHRKWWASAEAVAEDVLPPLADVDELIGVGHSLGGPVVEDTICVLRREGWAGDAYALTLNAPPAGDAEHADFVGQVPRAAPPVIATYTRYHYGRDRVPQLLVLQALGYRHPVADVEIRLPGDWWPFNDHSATACVAAIRARETAATSR